MHSTCCIQKSIVIWHPAQCHYNNFFQHTRLDRNSLLPAHTAKGGIGACTDDLLWFVFDAQQGVGHAGDFFAKNTLAELLDDSITFKTWRIQIRSATPATQ